MNKEAFLQGFIEKAALPALMPALMRGYYASFLLPRKKTKEEKQMMWDEQKERERVLDALPNVMTLGEHIDTKYGLDVPPEVVDRLEASGKLDDLERKLSMG